MSDSEFPLGQRLREAAKEKYGEQGAQAALVRESGVDQSSLGKIWRGGAKTSKYTPLLAKILGVHSLWLADGIEPKHELANAAHPKPTKHDCTNDARVIYYEDIDFSTGKGEYPPNHSELEKMSLPIQLFKDINAIPERCFIASIKGDSMEHTLSDGDRVLVNMDETNWMDTDIKKSVFAFNNGGNCLVRRFAPIKNMGSTEVRGIRIISDNHNKSLYPDIVLEGKEMTDIQVLGRVCWHSGIL